MRLNQLLPFRSKTDRRAVYGFKLDTGTQENFLSISVRQDFIRPDVYVVRFPNETVLVLMERAA